MASINFYQLAQDNRYKSICRLLEKCYQSHFLTIVRVETLDIQESINNSLWTFAQKSFIPHGSSLDHSPELQPIYITTGKENPNNANTLMLVDTIDGVYEDFQRLIVIIDTNNERLISSAKNVYEKLNTANNTVKYYIQNDNGSWQQAL